MSKPHVEDGPPGEKLTEEKQAYPLSQSLTLGVGTFLTAGVVDLLAHLGPTGLVVGGLAAYIAARHGPEIVEQVRGILPSPAPGDDEQPEEPRPQRSSRSVLDRALGRFPDGYARPQDAEQDAGSPAPGDEVAAAKPPEGDIVAAQEQKPPTVRRLTIDEIVQHIEPNSYTIYIGRSLTRPGNPAILINFYKQHFKLIGVSQRGKSSMAAAFLEIVIRTHDTDHVLVVLLDLEDRTSNLFRDIDHLAEVCVNGEWVPLHARTHEQVLEYLGYVVEITRMRYDLSEEDRLQQPIVLVYLEEFIELKDYFKTRIDTVPDHEKAQARRDYADLVYRIKTIARLGLKARVQFLICAQVDYRDDDLQEALINVTSGMAFSVLVTAARAAGFYRTDLLTRNAKEDKEGQAVAEMPGCKDLVLAPEYDLGKRLLALEEAEREQGRKRPRKVIENSPLRSASERKAASPSPFQAEGESRQRREAEASNVLRFNQPIKKQPTLLELGIAAYKEGATTQPKLAAALGISPWEARNLMPKIEAEVAHLEANGQI